VATLLLALVTPFYLKKALPTSIPPHMSENRALRRTDTEMIKDLKLEPPPEKTGSILDANFPRDAEGRVYHLGVKRGEVCNRILSVGDPKRAALLATMLDDPEKSFRRASNRGFTIWTGHYKRVPVSIIATGMGIAMMDFLVRESRAIIDGTLVIIRLGTCGTISSSIKIGSMAVASKGSIMIQRNVDAYLPEANANEAKYLISKPSLPDPKLSELLVANLRKNIGTSEHSVVECLNATGDSFYSSQGRIDPNFIDHNSDLIDSIASTTSVNTLEMETFHLFHLANCCKVPVKAAATTIVLAQRRSNEFLDNDTIKKLEKLSGAACLESLCTYPLGDKEVMDNADCVWLQKPK